MLFQVVLVHVAHNKDQVRATLQRSPALHVRGRHIVAWARHLAALQRHMPSMHQAALSSSELLHQYMELDGVPQQLVEEAFFATNDDQVQALATGFHRQRSGYTETRSSATLAAANAAAQLGVPFADPDAVCCALSCTFREFVSVAPM